MGDTRSGSSSRAAGAAPDSAVGLETLEKRVAAYRARAVAYARALRKPPFRPETVHRLRTHLRRLQAYAEFLDRPRTAKRLARCVSGLSRLRALSVFHQYLRSLGAPAGDLDRVREALREEEEMVAGEARLEGVRSVLAGTTMARLRRPRRFLASRLASLGGDHADRLSEALQELSAEPTRKELHRLRLVVKSIRYQEEAALETGWGRPQRVAALKQLQKVLGGYCDRDQFRRLAKTLGLASREGLKKEYRRYWKRAQAAVRRLGPPAARVIRRR
ncbi:MAG TPA: CHAD domain-containing protein [Nitrospirales bacterium]|nr:CHAD domain-containing protein [Nitrospirales bacterium]